MTEKVTSDTISSPSKCESSEAPQRTEITTTDSQDTQRTAISEEIQSNTDIPSLKIIPENEKIVESKISEEHNDKSVEYEEFEPKIEHSNILK